MTSPPGTLLYDYDNICSAIQSSSANDERPLYDEAFTLDFIQMMMTKGIIVFSLQAPESSGNSTSDWNGRAVNMVIEPGTSKDMRNMEPKLEWTILPGGVRFEVYTTSVALLSIHSISASFDHEAAPDGPDKVHFTITTDEGVVYIFEANSPEERDMMVNGLRNVLSRLAYQLIAGDPMAALGLYKDDNFSALDRMEDGSPWTCTSPDQTMNKMTHLLLDQ